jgi:hypothetical protein
MRGASLLAALVTVGVAAYAGHARPALRAEDSTIQQILVRTIVAEHRASTFCVLLGPLQWNGDLLVLPEGPSRAFLADISIEGKALLPARGCRVSSTTGVVAVAGQEPAALVTVSDVAHPAPNTAEVDAGVICGPICAWGFTYVLQKRDGRWVVTGLRNATLS